MGLFDECTTLEEAVYQAVGAASVCWDNIQGAGVFDDRQATQVAEDLLAAIRQWMNDVQFTILDGESGSMPETVRAEDIRLREEKYNA